MAEQLRTNEQANCDDWTKILLHCRECGVQFQRKVKGQRYCEEHRHLAGEVIRPQDTPTSNQRFPLLMSLGVNPRGDLEREAHDALAEIERLRGEVAHLQRGFNAAVATLEAERTAHETTPLLLSPLGKDCGQGSGHVAVKLLTTNDGTAHACEKCSTMWFVPYGAAVKAFAGRGPDDAEFGTAEWRRDNEQK